MRRRATVLQPFLLLFVASSVCSQPSNSPYRQSPVRQEADKRSLIQQMVNNVSRENIVRNIGVLQGFGNRYEYGPEQETAANWIVTELSWPGVKAESDPFKIGTATFTDLDMLSQDTAWIAGVSGLLSSTDGGRSWAKVTTPLTGGSSAIQCVEFVNASVGVIASQSPALYRTIDGGKTWTLQATKGQFICYDIGLINERATIAVGALGQIQRSTDAGASWSLIASGTTSSLRKLKIIDSVNVFAVGLGGTVIRSSDGGATWSQRPSGTSATLFGVEFLNAKLGWATGSGSTILQTLDGGMTWRSLAEIPAQFPGKTFYDICFSDSLHGWISASGGTVLRTTDAGRSWTGTVATSAFGTTPTLNRIAQIGGKSLLACGALSTIVCSSDGGVSWSSQMPTMPSDLFHETRNLVLTLPGRVTPEKECIVCAHYDGVSVSPGADDNGSGTSAVMEAARILKDYQCESTVRLILWAGEELGLLGSNAYAARAKNQKKNIIGVINADMIGYPLLGDTTRLLVGTNNVVFPLADSALIYNQRYGIGAKIDLSTGSSGSDHVPFTNAGYMAVVVAEGSSQEIWSGKNPFYHTAKDSLSKLHPGMMRRATQLMIAMAAELAAPISRTDPSEVPGPPPQTFALEQNFPNPFNPTSSFEFKVPSVKHVTLKIFDALGREIATLVNEQKNPGTYRLRWDAGNLPSGVYFYRMQAGTFVETKRMMLLK